MSYRIRWLLFLGALLPFTSQAALYPPPTGTDRESEDYLRAAEDRLATLDLSDAGLVFHRLGGTTATNWSVESDGQIVADLKCSSGNTNHHGAIIAYRLGRELGFPIYPVAVYRSVDRKIHGRTVDEQCALKEWASVFTQYYWTRDTFANTSDADKAELSKALNCEHPAPNHDQTFSYHAHSAYGHPRPPGTKRAFYRGDTSLLQAARDFSNMMVIDTLLGNEDRFPGGNIFFRSVSTSFADDNGQIAFHEPRLFSLDNEAALKGQGPASTHSAKDLKSHVSRFDADMIAKLRRLAADDTRLGKITEGNVRFTAFIREGIQLVLDQFAAAEAQCGRQMATF